MDARRPGAPVQGLHDTAETEQRSPTSSLPRGVASGTTSRMAEASHFDRDYYERFYRDPKTTVYTLADVERLGAFVCAYIQHMDHKVLRVLDIGCGLGFWRPVITKYFPKVKYTGVEYSQYLCEEYGWTQGSVVDYEDKQSYDLVICQGVLQYLGHKDAAAAIANLATLCSGVLYLEALTTEDWETNCDQDRTDGTVHLRKASWYRRRLAPMFTNCGGGLFANRDSDIVLYELEKLN